MASTSCLAALLQRRFQLERDVEMLHQPGLAAAGHHAELLDPRSPGFLHRILDQRLIDDRQHFLRRCLGRRQEAGSKASNGENSLTQRLHEISLGSFIGVTGPQVVPRRGTTSKSFPS